ncbi:MAG: hypothetical protein Q7R93_02910 [bacterium]|nr:hypothetical protein [bacterium]
MVIKQPDQKHFTKHFGKDGFSHRVILPGRDESRVKVTRFLGREGAKFLGVKNQVDETVVVTRGLVEIFTPEETTLRLHAGGTYYLPAGETYTLTCLKESRLVCIFSQAADGTMPQNEPDPAN